MIHHNPKVRKVISDICYFYDGPDLSESARQQVDSSLIPPRTASGRVVSESMEDAAAKQLAEDLKELVTPAKPESVS